jgi:Amidohydrolase
MAALLLSRRQALALLGLPPWLASPARAAELPIFDAHVHYSHDAVELVPPKQAVQLLRAAGLKGAFVSSSNDDGTQLLLAEAPDLIVPELRPYRTRSDTSGWTREPDIVRYMEQRLAKYRYAGVGEFHLYGDEADLPVPRRLVALARERNLVLHAHSDATAVNKLFQQWPEARVLWAHSGFDRPEAVRDMLRRHPRLWCDLAYRSDQATLNRVHEAWKEAFQEFPDRFMVGSDTFTPERWHYIGPHAAYSRGWLAALPPALAERIAWRNAEALLRGRGA